MKDIWTGKAWGETQGTKIIFGAFGALGLISLLSDGPPPAAPPSPTPLPALPGRQVRGYDIVQVARQFTGRGFTWEEGATGPTSFDCSGFVWTVFNRLGVKIPRTASQQAPLDAGGTFRLITENMALTTPGSFVVFLDREDKEVKHIEISSGAASTLASQVSGGVKEYKWGWWKSAKQQAKWIVVFGVRKEVI